MEAFPAMLPPELEKPLSQIELQCGAVAAAMSSGDPVALEAASAGLRLTALEFSRLLEGDASGNLSNPAFKARVKKIANELASQREGLIRHTASVERALHAVVPATRTATYGKPAGLYGAAAQQAGGFRQFAA